MKTVLFICVHNSGRSQMAEAFFNQAAKGKASAVSAGSQPDNRVNPTVVKAMLEAGIDISHNRPRLLTENMMEGIDRAITMGCKDSCPLTGLETEDWDIEDPKGKPIEKVRIIRDDIRARVARLAKEMTQ